MYLAAGTKPLLKIWLLNRAEPPLKEAMSAFFSGFVYFYLNRRAVITASLIGDPDWGANVSKNFVCLSVK